MRLNGIYFDFLKNPVSTHAPARGATVSRADVLLGQMVSTHAPARGATSMSGMYPCAAAFQPTHPHGVRLIYRFLTPVPAPFQPTHPHGVRQSRQRGAPLGTGGFNPRTRTGCDRMSTQMLTSSPRVSTHAPARGATLPCLDNLDPLRVSTHAPARGATTWLTL